MTLALTMPEVNAVLVAAFLVVTEPSQPSLGTHLPAILLYTGLMLMSHSRPLSSPRVPSTHPDNPA